MKDDPLIRRRRLLNDLWQDRLGTVNRQSQITRQLAITAFRRARFRRSACRFLGMAAVLAGITAGIILWQRPTPRDAPVAWVNINSPQKLEPSIPLHHSSNSLPTLSDEQLIASFPPHACFLAEVEGRQVLVFTDPALEAQFLHKPRMAFVEPPP